MTLTTQTPAPVVDISGVPPIKAAVILAQRGEGKYDFPDRGKFATSWYEASRWQSYSGRSPEEMRSISSDDLRPLAEEWIRDPECVASRAKAEEEWRSAVTHHEQLAAEEAFSGRDYSAGLVAGRWARPEVCYRADLRGEEIDALVPEERRDDLARLREWVKTGGQPPVSELANFQPALERPAPARPAWMVEETK